MTTAILQLVANDDKRCEAFNMTSWNIDTQLEIPLTGDYVSEMYLTLEIEDFHSYRNEKNVYEIIDDIIFTYKYNQDEIYSKKISGTSLYIDYCINKNTKFITSNDKIIYTLPINTLFWLESDGLFRTCINVIINDNYKQLVKSKSITFKNVFVDLSIRNNIRNIEDNGVRYNNSVIPIGPDIIKYNEYRYIINDSVDGKICITIPNSFKLLRDITIFINDVGEKDLKVLDIKLLLNGNNNDCDIDFYRKVFPKKYYNTILPYNMFIIPFDDNKNSIPTGYLNDSRIDNKKILIEFDTGNINGTEIIFLSKIFPYRHKKIFEAKLFNF